MSPAMRKRAQNPVQAAILQLALAVLRYRQLEAGGAEAQAAQMAQPSDLARTGSGAADDATAGPCPSPSSTAGQMRVPAKDAPACADAAAGPTSPHPAAPPDRRPVASSVVRHDPHPPRQPV